MPKQIKICGLTTKASIDAAITGGADYIGVVHYEPSPRHVSLEVGAALREYARDASDGRLKTVLLTVNMQPHDLEKAVNLIRPDVLQFHGRETPDWLKLLKGMVPMPIWKALGVRDAQTLAKSERYKDAVDLLLFDAPAKALPGGNGEAFDWHLLAEYDHQIAWGLAGGLTPENVAEAIKVSGAELVDTSSGVESAPGTKDPAKILAFCKAVQRASVEA